MSIPKQGIVVAIDGPAGSGKSSVTKLVSEKTGFVHIDTGALYRAIAHGVYSSKDSPELEKKAAELSRSIHLEFKRDLTEEPSSRILANGKDITDFIRTPEMSLVASRISAFPEVRAALLGLQRRLGCRQHSILEGRDIGTVIFPDADLKVFLTASVMERAKRRHKELQESGKKTHSLGEIKKQIKQRDHNDSTRAHAPLKKAKDALLINTSKMTLNQVVKTVENKIKKLLKQKSHDTRK